MEDEDLIEGIKSADGEKIKESLIAELELQIRSAKISHDSKFLNSLRNCLRSILERAGVQLPL
jgi:hypothetical protein